MKEPTNERVNDRIKEIQKKMKGVKRVVIKVTYEIKTGQMTVQHSPKTRFDPDLVLGMLVMAMQWLSADWYKKGILKVPMQKDKRYIA